MRFSGSSLGGAPSEACTLAGELSLRPYMVSLNRFPSLVEVLISEVLPPQDKSSKYNSPASAANRKQVYDLTSVGHNTFVLGRK